MDQRYKNGCGAQEIANLYAQRKQGTVVVHEASAAAHVFRFDLQLSQPTTSTWQVQITRNGRNTDLYIEDGATPQSVADRLFVALEAL
jgi:hypothetical protein